MFKFCGVLLALLSFYGAADAEMRLVPRPRAAKTVLLWHPMKTGGTTVCLLARLNEFGSEFDQLTDYEWYAMNCKMLDDELGKYTSDGFMQLQMTTDMERKTTYRRFQGPIRQQGVDEMAVFSSRRLIAFEPSHPTDKYWLGIDLTKMLANQEIWDSYFHALVIRHPVERIVSHLLFVPEWSSCVSIDQLPDLIEKLFSGGCVDECGEGICTYLEGVADRYYIRHFSGVPLNLHEAISNLLRHVDAVVPFVEEKAASVSILKNAMGWNKIPINMPKGRISAGAQSSYRDKHQELFNVLEKHVTEDMVFFDVAMEQARRWCVVNDGCEWRGSSDEVNEHRRQVYEYWSQTVEMDS